LQANIHLNKQTKKEDFIRMRELRDSQLTQPRLIIPSIQINIQAGEFPSPENNGICYLKIPINALKITD
jgi:hypothetical protein